MINVLHGNMLFDNDLIEFRLQYKGRYHKYDNAGVNETSNCAYGL